MKVIKLLPLVLCLSWPAQAQGVSKAVWIEGMSTKLPALFCDSKQYFRRCYRVTPDRCEEVATSATRICLQKFSTKMPAQFQQRQEAENWGRTIGECAGETYSTVLSKEFIDSQDCNNPLLWVK